MSSKSLNDLMSILGQTIIIVTMGIMARKFDWLPKDTSALSVIVGKCALPAIFFLFSATLDIGSYNWAPITAVMSTKAIMIILSGLIAWIGRFDQAFQAWGIMGIFVTQSNDIALGIPVINALWDNDKTHFGDYAIIYSTLSLLTSSICIAFILIGDAKNSRKTQKKHMRKLSQHINEKQDDDSASDDSRGLLSDENSLNSQYIVVETENFCWKVTKALLKNQLLLSVIIGLIVNIICREMGSTQLPLFFAELLGTIAAPFDFLALLLMGIGMSGKINIATFFGRTALFPIMLVAIKMIIFPVVARGILTAIWPLSGLKDQFDEFQNFTFLYGLLPPAITPVVLAQSFNVMPDQILNGMLISIILCAPYMFLTSIIFGISVNKEDNLANSVDMMEDVMNILSVICGMILFSAFIFHKPWRRFP
eukprot:517598_1